MTATATSASRKRTSGLRTSQRTSNIWRANKLGGKTRQTNCSNIFCWYRGSWGRYTQADPIGLKRGKNLYRYAYDSPVRYDDPRGLTCSANCPECPRKTWVFYGANLGFTVTLGSLGYGASIGVADAKCLSSSKTCTYFIICSRLFGLGLSADLAETVGLAFNAPCSDDIGGVSWGFDVDILDGAGGTGNFSSSPSGNFSVGTGFGVGVGASGTLQVCQAEKISCR